MRRLAGSVLIWLAISSAHATAETPGASAWAASDQARVRLISATEGVPESGRARLAHPA